MPYLRGVQALPNAAGGKDRASHAYCPLTISHTSLTSRPMTVVFDLRKRLRVHMRTKLENGILSNRQQPQSVVNVLLTRVNLNL